MKNKSLVALTFLWVMGSTVAFAESIDDLFFSTEIYPPFNLQKENELKGIAVDLLVAIFEKMHAKSTRKDIHLSPWARGYQRALKRKNSCIFSTVRSQEREGKFQWVGPIHSTNTVIVENKKSNIKIKSIADVRNYRTGVVIDDIGEQLLVAAGIRINNLDRMGGVNVISQSLKKLAKGRIKLFVYDENVVKWTMHHGGFNADNFKVVHTLKSNDLYYACNKDTPKAVLNRMQNTLDQLKKDGTYKKIVDRYL